MPHPPAMLSGEANRAARVRISLSAAVFAIALGGCAVHRPVQSEPVAGLGHFEYREPSSAMEGIVIGAPHGTTDGASARLAKGLSERSGAGLVVAYGFKAKRLSVAQPIVRLHPHPALSDDPLKRGSIFREYRNILRRTAKGKLAVYVGVHLAEPDSGLDRIEVASSGITFEQAGELKESFLDIRDRLIGEKAAAKIGMALEPLDKISWRVAGVKHHGALMLAEKGLNLRIPPMFLSGGAMELYQEILSAWIEAAVKTLRENPRRLPEILIRMEDQGRFEVIPARRPMGRAVLGSPHGTFDEFTAEVVKRISYRTGIAAVIATGFTPTQAGGWRINVNRPTEKTFPSDGAELHTERAAAIYENFKNLVLESARGELDLYIEVHQYNTDARIQVATVGLDAGQAGVVKTLYGTIRDLALERNPAVHGVEMAIEPLDDVPIDARAAKREGMFKVAGKGLHFELPAQWTLAAADAREVYTKIIADLISETIPLLLP